MKGNDPNFKKGEQNDSIIKYFTFIAQCLICNSLKDDFHLYIKTYVKVLVVDMYYLYS